MRINHARRDGITLILFGMIIGITLMLAMVVIGHQSAAQGAEKVHRPPLPTWARTPCTQEGDVNCFWNASEQGNGSGHSYYVRQFPGPAHTVCVMYTERKFGQKFDYCVDDRVPHHRPSAYRTRHQCKSADSVNCFHRYESREFPAFYSMRTYLTDTHGNDDLGTVICHFYVRRPWHDGCEAQDLFGS